MGDKSVKTLGGKIRFSASWKHPPPLSFLLLRQRRPHHLHNIELGARGIRELTLDANKIEKMLKYRTNLFLKVYQLPLSLIGVSEEGEPLD